MNAIEEEIFIRTICSQLDASVEQLGPLLTERLQQARQSAISRHVSLFAKDSSRAELLDDVRHVLDRTESLSPDINAQLDVARRLAVAELQRRNESAFHRLNSRIQIALSGLLDVSQFGRPAQRIATSCVLVTVVSLSYFSFRPASTLPLDEEIALIASTEDFELVENLEFYMWLAENGLPN